MAKKISAADIVKSSRNSNEILNNFREGKYLNTIQKRSDLSNVKPKRRINSNQITKQIGTRIRTKNGRTFYKPNNSDTYYESRSKNQYAQITGIGLNRISNDVKKVIPSEGYNVYNQSYIDQNFKTKNNIISNTTTNKTNTPKRKDLVTRNQPAYSPSTTSKTTVNNLVSSNRPASTNVRKSTRINTSNKSNTSVRTNVNKTKTPKNSNLSNNTNTNTDEMYSVKKGDTLSSIARRNGISLQELLKNNSHIKDPNKIYVGDKINLTNNSNNTKTKTSTPKSKLDDIIFDNEYEGEAPGSKFTKDIPQQLDTTNNEVVYKYNKKKIRK